MKGTWSRDAAEHFLSIFHYMCHEKKGARGASQMSGKIVRAHHQPRCPDKGTHQPFAPMLAAQGKKINHTLAVS